MNIELRNIHLERNSIRGPYDIALGVVADLEWRVGNRLLFSEEMVPVVELALALRRWLAHGLPREQEFSYDSIESDESGLIWIRPEGSGWRVGALYQEYPEMTEWSVDEISNLFSGFTEKVERWLRADLGIGLDDAR